MDDVILSETRNNFLFGEPPAFFDAFEPFERTESPLRPAISAFKANLSSAVMVGNIPFQLAQSKVLDQRFNQIASAERIRLLPLPGEPAHADSDKTAFEIAKSRMNEELKNQETRARHAKNTLTTLAIHLANDEFKKSADELLRQIVVMAWGAFEICANDALRLLLNERPRIIRQFFDSKAYRDQLSARALLESLEVNNFNVSSVMGDIFVDVVKLDSLEKIRDAIHIAMQEPEVDRGLKDERLWKTAQQRHLIVHRRGLIDSRYLESTSDKGSVGTHLKLDARYAEEVLVLVRDCGCKVFTAAQAKLGA
jgi:hypothetical protein